MSWYVNYFTVCTKCTLRVNSCPLISALCDTPVLINGMVTTYESSIGGEASFSCDRGFMLDSLEPAICTEAEDGNSASFTPLPSCLRKWPEKFFLHEVENTHSHLLLKQPSVQEYDLHKINLPMISTLYFLSPIEKSSSIEFSFCFDSDVCDYYNYSSLYHWACESSVWISCEHWELHRRHRHLQL